MGMRERVKLVLLAFAATLALAACGSQKPKANPRLQRDLAQARADIAHLQKVSAPVKRSSLMGTPAMQEATGRFLDHLDRSSIPALQKNRLIDHAAAAVLGLCGQCFQMLEADRPIPELAHPNA